MVQDASQNVKPGTAAEVGVRVGDGEGMGVGDGIDVGDGVGIVVAWGANVDDGVVAWGD